MRRGNQLSRTWAIQNLIRSSKEGLTAAEVHAALGERFPCDRKTINRDLASLVAQGYLVTGAKTKRVARVIVKSSSRSGVREHTEVPLPPADPIRGKRFRVAATGRLAGVPKSLGLEERFTLVLAEMQMEALLGTRIHRRFRNVTEWIEDTLPPDGGDGAAGLEGASLKQLRKVFRVYGTPLMKGLDFAPSNLNVILKACLAKRGGLRFDYKASGKSDYEEKCARAYCITLNDNSLYLTAATPQAQFWNFALSRMRDVSFDPNLSFPAKADVKAVTEELFGLQTADGDLMTVKLHFHPHLSKYVAERQWPGQQGPAQFSSWEDGTKNSLLLTLRLRDSKDLRRWILGWGASVQVLEPQELRTKIRKAALAVANMY